MEEILWRAERSRKLYDMVRAYQPECLVNSRIGNGLGDYRSLGDNEIPEACADRRPVRICLHAQRYVGLQEL